MESKEQTELTSKRETVSWVERKMTAMVGEEVRGWRD